MGGAFMPSPPHEVHPAARLTLLIPAKAGIQGRGLGPRFRGDERKMPRAGRRLRDARAWAELRPLQSPAYAWPTAPRGLVRDNTKPSFAIKDPWEVKMTSMRLWHLGGALIAAIWLAPAAFAQVPQAH